ncbi:hypothetical protein GFY24_30170 [Nocardia sp. SYP-A9097]|uniref:hypothetical protein n=1 Tax=Nocardia sp. SYP-A9097 TaxID=2663237 RepID=UPI00129A4B9A|nr:hypothetical protein [Nocardia sp. SYP-A9097]MRH91656.1 hypothetical protein [Nocardia sp. SYP-A9097]
MRDGVVPDAVVLAHEDDLGRLARLTPEALPNAVVAGDPCLDRLRASTILRQKYRKALGAEQDSTVVTVTSTWGPGSLLGQRPDLINDLLAELELDHIVTTVLHPNVWFAHGQWQLRTWLADALRAGLRLIPPVKGWQQTILASDVVIGDHGSVTGYAAAMLVPTMLAAFPHDEVATGTAIDRLGRSAPILNSDLPLREQISMARHNHDHAGAAQLGPLASSHLDSCADILRTTFYGLMDLPEPGRQAPVFPYPPADLVPEREPVHSCWLTCDWPDDKDDTAVVHRWPADVTARRRRGPRALDGYLAVRYDHPRRDLSGTADITVLGDTDPSGVDDALRRTIRLRPACMVAVLALDETRLRLCHRRLGILEAHTAPALSADPMAQAVVAMVVHDHWLIRGESPPATIAIHLESRRILLHLKGIDPKAG